MPSSSNHEHILSINMGLLRLETTMVSTRFTLAQISHSILRELYSVNKYILQFFLLTVQIVIPILQRKAIITVACID